MHGSQPVQKCEDDHFNYRSPRQTYLREATLFLGVIYFYHDEAFFRFQHVSCVVPFVDPTYNIRPL